MLPDSQIKILMLVHELEKTLGTIYQQFSDNFPEHNDMKDSPCSMTAG